MIGDVKTDTEAGLSGDVGDVGSAYGIAMMLKRRAWTSQMVSRSGGGVVIYEA